MSIALNTGRKTHFILGNNNRNINNKRKLDNISI